MQSREQDAPQERGRGSSDIRELAGDSSRPSPKAVAKPAAHLAQPSAVRKGGAKVTNYLNKTLVAAYKLVGFSLLTAILFGLFAYVALNGLFFLHHGWVAPAIIAPSDLRVVELRARLAHEAWNRQKVEAELAQVEADLRHARRTVEMEDRYQSTFQTAVTKNASIQWGRLRGFQELKDHLQGVRSELEAATSEFSKAHVDSVKTAFEANLIDKHQKATEDFRLAELSARRVQLQQQEAELANQLSQLTQQAKAMRSVAREPSDSAPATYEGLQLKRSYLNSMLEKDRASDEVEALQSASKALTEALRGYDEVLGIIKESPLLLAASGELTVAFVPYENLANVNAGDEVFGCSAQVVWCEKVGRVGEMIEGEVTAKHPIYGSDLRGKFVRLQLDDPTRAQDPVLHVGRPPLLL